MVHPPKKRPPVVLVANHKSPWQPGLKVGDIWQGNPLWIVEKQKEKTAKRRNEEEKMNALRIKHNCASLLLSQRWNSLQQSEWIEGEEEKQEYWCVKHVPGGGWS